MAKMSLRWLEEIERRANVASPGERDDAIFAASARSDVPTLCRVVRELIDAMRQLLDASSVQAPSGHVQWPNAHGQGYRCIRPECPQCAAESRAQEVLHRVYTGEV